MELGSSFWAFVLFDMDFFQRPCWQRHDGPALEVDVVDEDEARELEFPIGGLVGTLDDDSKCP